ncbi:MAG TPA: Maf family protein [Fimbriimonadaceae bacterium]|nr:Maf family protein [Fimbriimonadaceae bacterium]
MPSAVWVRMAFVRIPFPVVLASASPRRQELLRRLVDGFEVLPAHLDEDALVDPDPWVTAQRIAREKALAVSALRPDALVIAGDTVVAVEEVGVWRQLAKPRDAAHAEEMLADLSGRTHTVVTGVCLRWPSGMSAFTETARVTFRKLDKGEIARYVATGSPLDKAGAYGLQDESQDFIERVEGDVDTVIGLPVARLQEALQAVR